MNPAELFHGLQNKFPGSPVLIQESPDLVVGVPPEKLLEVAVFLRDTAGYAFDYLIYITAVDRVDYLEAVYGIRSIKEKHQIILKVKTPAIEPQVPSVSSVWPAADWDERETFDLFGIRFAGHPNLCRILLPDEWEGHPLRKDYAITQRPVKAY